ncbi:hypothetical protein [Arthrobacter sp. UKPF54-2]|uniref:hypothetical protein n=1 Tax=Arthrobacter sp. UKPF54-2 TaxID=2600159 RepID=UPI0021BDC2E6|nr:hypothetical protein [Arthrobacter sp. UKPF54-2]
MTERWDPFFRARMSLADVYAYPVDHFDFHAAQLSAEGPVSPQSGSRPGTGK